MSDPINANAWKSLRERCMQRDRFRLHRRWQQLTERPPQEPERRAAQWQAWHDAVATSVALVDKRRAERPVLSWPEALPVVAAREELLQAIAAHQVVIIAGETGSGKTTQIPKICLELGRGVTGLIGHTQPRRLAARTIAARISEELESPPGKWAGYKIRFQDTLEDTASIKLMTDGILLAEIQHDRFLDQYDTLIIDEAHERSLNIDFLLGYLKRILPRRPDLKVIITSATIDPQRFSRHFNDAPVIEVSGRTYPVDVLYRPLDESASADAGEPADDEDQLEAGIIRALDEIDAIERSQPGVRPGGVLVFLPGEGEIRRVATRLRRYGRGQVEVLPLYSRLSTQEQNRVFEAPRVRRVVLATNVAETSVTVPHIGYVIDSGIVRMSRYSVRTKVQRLPLEPVSQASARQRAGRCGRIAPGVCIRLYSEESHAQRPLFTEPEIHRTNLASVILQMAGLGLGEVMQFPFVEPPDERQVNDGYRLLEELGALDGRRQLSAIGRELLRLPLDPRLARVLSAAAATGCLREALVIAAALGTQDVWLHNHDSPGAVDEARKPFQHERSDFLTWVKLWAACEAERAERSTSGFRKWLLANRISYLRYNEWREVHRQLHLVCNEFGWTVSPADAPYETLHRAILAGFITQVGMREEEREYRGTRGRRFLIQRGSSQASRRPKWIVAAELVETRVLAARCVAAIEPEWIEEVGAPLLKRRHFEPHWEKRQAAAVLFEETSLYGLVLTPRRKVLASRIDPVQARELFIRHALVAGDYDTRAPFFAHNQQLLADVSYREEKVRRRDLMVDDETLFLWFDERIPASVVNGTSFDSWRKQAERSQPGLLFLQEADITRPVAEDVAEQFPDQVEMAGTRLHIEYRFDPGQHRDGITVEVPLEMLNQFSAGALEWLVPALETDKVVALIKTLPKAIRKHFVPAPDHAARFLASNPDRSKSLIDQLTVFLRRESRVDVQAVHFQSDELPSHLRGKVRVIGEQGKVLGEGTDVARLQHDTREAFRSAVNAIAGERYTEGVHTDWDFGELPREEVSARGTMVIRTYPAVVDTGTGVRIEWCDREDDATQLSRQGVLRLILLRNAQQVKTWIKQPPFNDRTLIQYAPFGSREDLGEGFARAVYFHAFLHGQTLPRNREQFDALVRNGRVRVSDSATRIKTCVGAVLDRHHRISLELAARQSPARAACHADVRAQLARLLAPRWLALHEHDDIMEMPRYLDAIEVRLSRLQGNVERDEQSTVLVRAWEERLESSVQAWTRSGERVPAAVSRFRWWLEEWRIALFAQGVKTREPVSEKRIRQRFETLPGAPGRKH